MFKFFRKNNISYPLIHARSIVTNISFLENFAFILNELLISGLVRIYKVKLLYVSLQYNQAIFSGQPLHKCLNADTFHVVSIDVLYQRNHRR